VNVRFSPPKGKKIKKKKKEKPSCRSLPPYRVRIHKHMSLAFVHQDKHTAARCNKLQHTATHCSTLQGTAANCNTLQQHTATHCNTLQHTATLCRHTATATHCRQTHVYSATHCRQTHVYSGLHQDKFASSVPFAGLLAGLKLAGLSPAIQQGSRQHPRQEPLNKKCTKSALQKSKLPNSFQLASAID